MEYYITWTSCIIYIYICSVNNLSLNPSKCKCVSFSFQKKKRTTSNKINGFELQTSSIMHDLCLILSSDLTFNGLVDT